ncbi:OmpA family protein [Candidatus Marithrix sp. Canyon 246]|uniref:OmpA family protein n=1 Tax=Candidatus Marithrix sp. Canyon 246 TaxID=1827136 RepID=UPI00084A0B72|nr:OmpA family protein [Candidatus Marithrix sp. Canyon 246]
MSNLKLNHIQLPITLLSISLLASCVSTPVAQTSDLPISFNEAIPMLANSLLIQVKNKQGMLDGFGQKNIVLEPFIDTKSHQVVKVSRQIERIVFRETKKNFADKFTIKRLIPENRSQANYVMHGVILYEPYRKKGNFYHAISSVIDKKTSQVVAKSDVWISNKNLDYVTVKESPMVIQGSQSIAEEVVKLNIGAQTPSHYKSFLKAGALITKADAAYENKDYQTALRLYTQVTKQQSLEKKKMMNVYVGLYRTNIHLRNLKAAEKAFGKLVALSIEEYNTLGIKFLFLVSKTSFDRKLKAEYPIWLRQIGKYFKKNNLCLNIVGHSSHTGKLQYNCRLSLNRAEAIQQKLQPYYNRVKKKSKSTGKAWAANLVGSGTDNAQDAIDRRVEFKVVSCPVSDKLRKPKKIKSCVNSVSR